MCLRVCVYIYIYIYIYIYTYPCHRCAPVATDPLACRFPDIS